MKLSIATMIMSSTMAKESFANHYDGKIERNLFGNWVEENFGSDPRYFPGTGSTTKFEQIAKMVAFLEGKDATPEYLQQIEDDQTAYGCYCWQNGASNVQKLGGGKHMDAIDAVCSKLYRCYKCIDVDYNAHSETTGFSELSYSAFFGNDGSISCSENQKTSSEHLCQCDVDYAQAIADLRTECASGQASSCPKSKFYTGYSTHQGPFDYNSQCHQKAPMNQERDQCCGLYPNRRAYDKKIQECCETELVETKVYMLTKIDTCTQQSGTVVVSVPGNPNEYIPA